MQEASAPEHRRRGRGHSAGSITPEHRRAVADALKAHNKVYVNAEFSNADHAFFCDQRPSYEPFSARQAWALTLEFLRS